MKDQKGNISCHWEIHLHKCWLEGVKLNVRMTQRFGVVVFHRPMVNWQGGKLEGDSGSKLEGALLLGIRCHCMNTSSENMKPFHLAH